MADEPAYQVALFRDVHQKVAGWRDAVVRLNRIPWFIRAMNYIDEQLHACPATWGDPIYNLRNARLVVYQANHENFLVTYAVHLDRPIVFFRNIELFAGSPLYGQ